MISAQDTVDPQNNQIMTWLKTHFREEAWGRVDINFGGNNPKSCKGKGRKRDEDGNVLAREDKVGNSSETDRWVGQFIGRRGARGEGESPCDGGDEHGQVSV